MEFTLSNPEGTRTWSPTAADLWSVAGSERTRLEGLEIGEMYTDEDGYVWQRVK